MSRRKGKSSDDDDDKKRGGEKRRPSTSAESDKKKKAKRSRSTTRDNTSERLQVEVKCGPKPVPTSSKSQQKQMKRLREETKEAVQKATDPSASRSERTRASEKIGTEGAKTAQRIAKNTDSDDSIEEFDGAGVPDGFDTETNTILEAKGGSSQLGSRKTSSGKRARQCSPAYARSIAETNAQSNYKGRHPRVGCVLHRRIPQGRCVACQRQERNRRRRVGELMKKARAKGKLKKKVVRTKYDSGGVHTPTVTEVEVV